MTLAGKQGGEEGTGLESAPCVPGAMLGFYFPHYPYGVGVAFLCFQMGKLAERWRGIPQDLQVLKYCPGMGMQVLVGPYAWHHFPRKPWAGSTARNQLFEAGQTESPGIVSLTPSRPRSTRALPSALAQASSPHREI